MARCLSIVEECIMIRGRGIVFVPGIRPQGNERFRRGDSLLLKRPDGTELQVNITSLEMMNPNPRHEVVALIKDLTKDDIPIGTQVWSVEEA